MGAWGLGPFENDAALDCLRELENTEVADMLTESIRMHTSGYMDDDHGCRIIAAAELIAGAKYQQFDELRALAPGIVVKLQKPLPSDLVNLARAAVDRVMQSSETRELRMELPPQEF